MRVAIVGSRDYPNLEEVREYVRSLPLDTVIVSGGARGVDRVAEEEAKQRGMEALIFPADWDRWGKSAGYRRNKDIVDTADRVVAFWDGVSRGTMHSIQYAKQQGKPTRIHQKDD